MVAGLETCPGASGEAPRRGGLEDALGLARVHKGMPGKRHPLERTLDKPGTAPLQELGDPDAQRHLTDGNGPATIGRAISQPEGQRLLHHGEIDAGGPVLSQVTADDEPVLEARSSQFDLRGLAGPPDRLEIGYREHPSLEAVL